MQNQIVDKKIQVLYDNYKERSFARNAAKDAAQLRTSASNWGLGITLSAFVANEFTRMTMRSRKYSLVLPYSFLQLFSNSTHSLSAFGFSHQPTFSRKARSKRLKKESKTCGELTRTEWTEA